MRSILALVLLALSVSFVKADDETARIRRKLKAAPANSQVQLTDSEWRKILTPAQFVVLRQAGTEPAFHNEYAHTTDEGTYLCAACGNAVFGSKAKYDSGTGWPSFYAPLEQGRIAVAADRSDGMSREEVRCARCGSHLGHIFKDGPAPTHLRYCLNSAALKLKRTGN